MVDFDIYIQLQDIIRNWKIFDILEGYLLDIHQQNCKQYLKKKWNVCFVVL